MKELYDKRYLEGYQEKLNGYEFARWHALYHFILKVLKLRNVGTVLDYGSGSGLYVDLWKKVFPDADLHFCDISSVALEKLGEKYPEFKNKCSIVEGNIAGHDKDKFDAIVGVEVMEHVDDLTQYVNDIYRLLKPGGVFIWTTPCANRFSIEHIYNIFTGQIDGTEEGYRRWRWEDPAHLRRLKSSEIKSILTEVGFKKVGFRYRSHFFSFVCTRLFTGSRQRFGERMMLLDYNLFRRLSNGASMIGFAVK